MIPCFRLLAISDHASDAWLRRLASPGVSATCAVQLREKHLADRDLFALVRLARGIFPGTLLVNGRLDLALAAGADGVHLPADGVPAAALRRRFGPTVLIGRSTHRAEEVEEARRDAVDYVTFGPVFATPGKPGASLPGLAGLREAVAAAAGEVAVFALGGIGRPELAAVAAAGADGAAGIRLFQQESLDDLVRTARETFRRS